MGLAGTKVKQRFGLDPRNTSWSNDKSRFGHRYLESMGWAPGKGLGLVEHATTTHVKVSVKDDTVGLGAKLAKRSGTDDLETDSSGLDDFQRILGRLNGRGREVDEALEQKRKDNIINGKWGMHFIKGEVLCSTWDRKSKSHMLKTALEDESEVNFKSSKKRRQSGSEPSRDLTLHAKRMRGDESKKSTRDQSKQERKEKKIKTEKKEKKEKKEKVA